MAHDDKDIGKGNGHGEDPRHDHDHNDDDRGRVVTPPRTHGSSIPVLGRCS
jgi:hypothetical protein